MAFAERKRQRGGPQQQDAEYAPRRKARGQRPVDHFSSIIHMIKRRPYAHHPFSYQVPSHAYYCKDVLPPFATAHNPATALCTQWAYTAHYPDNRVLTGRPRRVLFTVLRWGPAGRKLLAATATGEFVMFNGRAFGVEHKTMAHEDNRACRALAWGHINDAILSGDEAGILKLWTGQLALSAELDTKQRIVRDVTWSPSERKIATAGQDGSARIWDAERVASSGGVGVEFDTKMEGHGSDVLSVAWHPTRALLATGSQDRDIRLWDPRKGADPYLSVLQGHTNSVTSVRWHLHGSEFTLLSGSRDGTARIWDTRMLRESYVFVGHTKDVMQAEWHPTHSQLFTTCGLDGLVAFWVVQAGEGGAFQPNGTFEVGKWTAVIKDAHDRGLRDEPNGVSCVAWSPMGHVMATSATEVNFWTRNKPGALEEIRYDASEEAATGAVGGYGAGGRGYVTGGAAGSAAMIM
mgnify:CR=1 FL=1